MKYYTREEWIFKQRFKLKRILIGFTIALCLVFAVSPVFSQTIQDRTIFSYQNIHKNHPDGTVGKLSVNFGSSYLSIKNQPGQPVVDATKFQAELGWVIADNFSERQSFTIITEFQTTYELSFGFSYYFSNPVNTVKVNPDGKIGSPIVSLDAIFLLDSYEETTTNKNFKAEILFPLTPAFSIFGGYTAYEEISPRDVEKIFGGLHIFLSSYTPANKYNNPDSPLTGMAVLLNGGSSEFGNYGQLKLALPASQSVTVKISARGDFLKAPYDKIYTGSLQINYYTGN